MFELLKKIFKKDQLILLGTGVSVTLIMIFFFISKPQFLYLLELKIYDHYLKEYHHPAATQIPVIIDLDEKSLAELGQWPWPRYRVAMLLKFLTAYGAIAVASDIIFVEPDRTSPNIMVKDLKNELQIDIGFQGLPNDLMDYDKLLAFNLKDGPYVLGIDFLNNRKGHTTAIERDASFIKPAKVAILSPPGAMSPHDALPKADQMICPIPILSKAAPQTGFITISPDLDSVYRRVPLLYSYNNQIYPNLALATLMQASGMSNMVLKMSSIGVESLKFNGVVIPTDANGQMLINYRGGMKTFEYISASDVLRRKLPAGHLDGRIAIIGTSASGLKDIRATPLDPGFPGVEAHATIIDNILSQQLLSVPDWAPGFEFVSMLICGILTTFLIMWARASWIILPLIGCGYVMWHGSVLLFEEQNYFISPMYAYLTLALTFTTLTIIKFWREEIAKRFIHGAFAHYLAPSVISQIMENPDALSLEGQEKDITIQFSDVRSFTSLSEKLTPTQVTDLLHDYLTPMTRIITEHEGTLDKFIGDAVMAFWNAPLDVEDHQEKSLQAALAQQEKLKELNVEFLEKYGFTIAVGIGIHSGSVRVGNMGSADLFDYTLIGDNVNLASRLESLTKYYGQKLIVSQNIVDACGDKYYFRILDNVRVKGKEQPVKIYTAYTLEEAESRKDELALYEKAHDTYTEMDFKEAKKLFTELKEADVEPLLYDLYIERCELLKDNPPECGWDCVFTHKTK
ncbi:MULTISPECIES: adenylate/guanylate cyclase domain-containing protein [unclassified Pseudodesulfovibrio]|uniref:CHASE2 domain-containing protein n=1 Tax=unclassified Pseudodesulfovibrio TaxID=2661612 RepID=UPI000FEB7AA7|nr:MULTISPECIES: adenylate/guanylate cyclase domain-containing protein [unclassified Pseudodesulfovibrio]MCJ2163933.1 adenylate/guanylate cyclase domain-containing protein [Pseudodesulfovibrio sp. S3-i]RWU05822.1 adenylate/guanylate cyclase domain-containing protein [Pseudodesulfovibrio sp. S3]